MKEYIDDLDFETVIDRLKQGQKLRAEETDSVLEIIDDFLVEHKGGSWIINPQISNGEFLKRWYFERPKPQLDIKVGKFYTSRSGKKAYVFAKNQDGKFNVAIEEGGAYSVFEGGYYSEEEETDNDLISVYDSRKNLKIGKPVNQERLNKIKELLAKNYKREEIAEVLGLNKHTIQSFIYKHKKDLGLK